jgi:hypothetical protein
MSACRPLKTPTQELKCHGVLWQLRFPILAMDELFLNVRSVQLALGMAYAAVAAAAAARAGSVALAAAGLALGLGAYLTGRNAPDASVPLSQVWRVAGAGLIILVFGCLAVATGTDRGNDWAAIVAGFCAGNRIKAAMPSRD